MSLYKYIFSVVLLLTGCDSSNQEINTALPMSVSVVRSEIRDFSKEIHLNGNVLAKELVNISTELTSKEILSVKVNPGDRVQKGQVLADLDMVNVQSQFKQNESKLRQAELSLKANRSAMEEAGKSLKRYQLLSSTKAVSQQELEKKRTAFDSAKASYESNKAEIESLKAILATSEHDRSKAQIKAPFSGIIVDKNAEEGDLTSDKPLFTMIKGEITEIDATASEDEIKYLKEGMEVRIENGSGMSGRGMIRLIYPALDGNSRLGRLKIRFCDDTKAYDQFRLGSYVDIFIRVDTLKQVMSLPLSAISFDRIGKASVKAVDAQGIVKKIPVRTGYISDDYVQITSNLPDSLLVISKADALVREGDKVKPVL